MAKKDRIIKSGYFYGGTGPQPGHLASFGDAKGRILWDSGLSTTALQQIVDEYNAGTLDGVTGVQGETGVQGSTGLMGPTGYMGVTGVQGDTGLQGIQGDQGDTGVQGVTGLGILVQVGDTWTATGTTIGVTALKITESDAFGDDQMSEMQATFLGKNRDNAERASYEVEASFYREGAGNLLELDYPSYNILQEVDADWDAELRGNTGTQKIEIWVQGDTGDTVDWKVWVKEKKLP